MRRSYFHSIIVTAMLLVAIPAGISPFAHAVPSYTPGVKVGDSVTYGQINLSYNHTLGIPQGLQQFNDTQSITDTVTAVDLVAKTVTMTQTYLLKNGTSQTTTLSGSVQDGSGNLNIFILAGALSAGEPLTQSSSSSFFGFITETVTRAYAGALRTVNSVSFGSSPQSGINSLALYWDQSSGFLLEAFESVTASNSNPQSFTIDIKVTSTNVWTASTAPDFGLDATFQTLPFVYRGSSAGIALNLTSFHGFSGTATLTPHLLNSSLTNPPTITLSLNNVAIPSGGSATSILTFASTASTALGLYLFSVNATVGTLQHGSLFALEVSRPDFEVIATPSSLNMAPGGTTTDTITVRALGLFTGGVTLSASGTGLLQTSLNRTSVTLTSSSTSVNSTLTIIANAYSLPSTSNININGASTVLASGFSPRSTNLLVTVTGGDFEISADTQSLSIAPGGTSGSVITLTSLGGFSGTVQLIASSYGGLAVSLSPTAVALTSGSTAHSKLTVTLPSGSAGYYPSASVTALSGLLSRSIYISVTVGGADFSISSNPTSITYAPGKTANSTITVTSLNGFAGTLSLSAWAGYGDQVGFALTSTSVTLTAGTSGTSKLMISMPSTLAPSFSYLNVFAYNGTSSRSTYVDVVPATTPPPPPPPPSNGPDFNVTVNPFSWTLARSSSASSTVTVNSVLGFAGTLYLSTYVSDVNGGACFGPSCVTGSLNRTVVNLVSGGSVNSILNIQVPSTAAAGTYYVSAIASNSTTFRYATVTVIVVAPDFTVFPNLDPLTLLQGSSATPTIIVASQDAFVGTVSLSANITSYNYNTCPGINCPTLSLAKSSLLLTANGTDASGLTITVPSNAPLGSYTVSVAAQSGGVSHYTSLNLNIIGENFQLSPSPQPLIINAGGSGVVSITVVSQSGFSGKVTLTPSPGYGLIVNTNPVNVTIPAGGWAVATISIATLPNSAPGYYSEYITGASGALSESTYAQVLVAGANFGLSLNQTSLTVQAGSSLKIPITFFSQNGFSGKINSTISQLFGPAFPVCPGPSCPTISFTPGTVILSSGGWSTSNLTIALPSTATPGQYSLTLNATTGSLSNQVYLSIQVTAPPATLLSVVVGSDGALYWSRLASSWGNWQPLAGSTNSPPAACSSGPGNAELIVRGNDNGIYHKSFTGGAWSASWNSPGGSTIDQPACAVLNNIVYLVARGSNNGVYANSFEFGFWTGWVDLSGSTASPPVLVASPQANRIDLVVRGTNNGIFHKALTGGVWNSVWDSPGGSTRDTPAVASDSAHLYLAVRGVDNSTYYNAFSFSTGWSSWTSLGGVVISAPALAVDPAGTVHVIVRGLDNGIYYKAKPSVGSWTPSWGLPIGYTLNTPTIQILGSNLVLLVRGADNGIYYNAHTGISWTGWLTLSGSTHLALILSIS